MKWLRAEDVFRECALSYLTLYSSRPALQRRRSHFDYGIFPERCQEETAAGTQQRVFITGDALSLSRSRSACWPAAFSLYRRTYPHSPPPLSRIGIQGIAR